MTGKRGPLAVGGQVFPTKAALRSFVREILYRYPPGSVVTGSGDDGFLRALIPRHKHAAEKVGAGIDRFEVRTNLRHPGFWIIRTDGSETDFSYQECITSTGQRSDVLQAFRIAAAPDAIAFIAAAFAGGPVRCVCGTMVADRSQAHADHYPVPFLALAKRFAATWPGGFEGIQLTRADGQMGAILPDECQAAWVAYHTQHARFRVLCIACNLSGRWS
jgi:Protein of unknown function (DUF3223)